MILVTIGTNDSPYDGLFEMMDSYAADTGEEVVMQIAHSTFAAKNCESFPFLPDDEFANYYDRADLIVCHAGIGTIINGLERNIPMVLVPRGVVDGSADNQQQIVAEKVVSTGRAVCLNDLSDLYGKISEARALKIEPYSKDTKLLDYIDGRLAQLSEKFGKY